MTRNLALMVLACFAFAATANAADFTKSTPYQNVYEKEKDMGDGTFAPVVATVAGNTGSSADQTQGNVTSGSADSGNPLKVGGVYNSTLPTFTTGQRGDLQIGSRGSLNISVVAANGATVATLTSAAADGVSASGTMIGLTGLSANYVFNGTSWDRAKKANSVSRIASAAASTNATSAKASAGNVHQIAAYNTTASVKFLKLYNKASAPTVGTDTPVLTLTIPPNGSLTMSWPNGGLYFATGIAYALTGAAADNDTTALSAGDVVGFDLSYD